MDPVALAIAKARDWLPKHGHLHDLSDAARFEVRSAAHVAVFGQPWHDAELGARDEHARRTMGGNTFNTLSEFQQHKVANEVAGIVTYVQDYFNGLVTPLSPKLRSMLELGAVATYDDEVQ